MSVPSDLRLSIEGAIAWLTFNRPAKRNALSVAMLSAMAELLRQIEQDPAVRVLVLSGAEGLPFSAGADIEELEAFAADPFALAKFAGRFAAAQQALADFAKPTIAMISGACVGGGCGLALGCDLRLADSSAKLGITPAKLGLDYSVADTKRLVDAVGYAHAADLLFSGRLVKAEEALAIGLVNRVIAPEALRAETIATARTIAANAPTSLRSIKSHLRALKAGQTGDDPASRQSFLDAFAGADFAEGLAAFRDKRPPDFPS